MKTRTVYGSDPFAYAAWLAGTCSGPRKGRERQTPDADGRVPYAGIPVFRYDADDFPSTGPDCLLGVSTLESPTPAQLKRHREKFRPEGKTFGAARKTHREACEDIARVYGLTGGDIEQMVSSLRSEGLSLPEIAERCSVPEGTVRMIVRGRGKQGSAARKTTSRSA